MDHAPDAFRPPLTNPVLRALAIVGGIATLAIGLAGFVIPGLPGTPFLLVAAWLFSLSNARLYHWMLTNRWFGRIVSDYRAGLGIPRRIKVIAVALATVTVALSVAIALDGRSRVAVIGLWFVGVTFILTRPTRENVEPAEPTIT